MESLVSLTSAGYISRQEEASPKMARLSGSTPPAIEKMKRMATCSTAGENMTETNCSVPQRQPTASSTNSEPSRGLSGIATSSTASKEEAESIDFPKTSPGGCEPPQGLTPEEEEDWLLADRPVNEEGDEQEQALVGAQEQGDRSPLIQGHETSLTSPSEQAGEEEEERSLPRTPGRDWYSELHPQADAAMDYPSSEQTLTEETEEIASREEPR